MPRESALEEARTFGMISVLTGDPNAPTTPFGASAPNGADALSYVGELWGSELGESGGNGGLGLTGIGEPGGGGVGRWVGLEGVGTCGSSNCAGLLEHRGVARGASMAPHATRVPKLRVGETELSGSLPSEVVQRIVRQNFGRFRLCYEQGLQGNPNLQGRVLVRFVIDRTGAVSSAMNGGSDLPDAGVVSCVVRAYYGLTFPPPNDGIVAVRYPILFSPG